MDRKARKKSSDLSQELMDLVFKFIFEKCTDYSNGLQIAMLANTVCSISIAISLAQQRGSIDPYAEAAAELMALSEYVAGTVEEYGPVNEPRVLH